MPTYPPYPINPETGRLSCDAVLLDDDPLIHMVWKLAASEKQKNVLFFSNVDDLLSRADDLHRSTPVYLDSNLGANIRGERVARELRQMGFQKIYLSTGYQPENLADLPEGVEIVGKEPPWV